MVEQVFLVHKCAIDCNPSPQSTPNYRTRFSPGKHFIFLFVCDPLSNKKDGLRIPTLIVLSLWTFSSRAPYWCRCRVCF